MVLLVIFLVVVGREFGEKEWVFFIVYKFMFIIGFLIILILYKY